MEPILNRYESCQKIYIKASCTPWKTQMNSLKGRQTRKLLFQTPKPTYSMSPFYDILEKAKPQVRICPGFGLGVGFDYTEQREGIFGGDGIVLHGGGGCMTLCNCQNTWDQTPKKINFTANKFKNKQGSCFKFNNNV